MHLWLKDFDRWRIGSIYVIQVCYLHWESSGMERVYMRVWANRLWLAEWWFRWLNHREVELNTWCWLSLSVMLYTVKLMGNSNQSISFRFQPIPIWINSTSLFAQSPNFSLSAVHQYHHGCVFTCEASSEEHVSSHQFLLQLSIVNHHLFLVKQK